jgi:hypothetical protein
MRSQNNEAHNSFNIARSELLIIKLLLKLLLKLRRGVELGVLLGYRPSAERRGRRGPPHAGRAGGAEVLAFARWRKTRIKVFIYSVFLVFYLFSVF